MLPLLHGPHPILLRQNQSTKGKQYQQHVLYYIVYFEQILSLTRGHLYSMLIFFSRKLGVLRTKQSCFRAGFQRSFLLSANKTHTSTCWVPISLVLRISKHVGIFFIQIILNARWGRSRRGNNFGQQRQQFWKSGKILKSWANFFLLP